MAHATPRQSSTRDRRRPDKPGPQFVAFAPDGRRAYVSIFNNDRTMNIVGVLDTTTSAFIATVPVGVRPFALDVSPDGRRVYVPNHDSRSITVIDTATNAVVDTIKVAPNPHWVDLSADGKTLYAANHESNVVSVIDTATDKVLTTVPVGLSPHSIVRHPTKPLLFNVNYDSSSMTVIDTNTNQVVKTIPTASHPQDISLSADGEHIYIAAVDDNAIQVFNTKTMEITARVPVGRSPTSVAVGRDGRQGYVTNLADGTVTILNLAVVDTGQDPPQRRLRRHPRDARWGGVEQAQQFGGDIGDPAGDRGERAHPGQHRRRAQRQHHRDRVIPPLITAPVGDPGEPSQQLRALHRGRRQAPANVRIGHDTIDRARARLGNGRMHQQRSSGRTKVCERTIVLPELRSPIPATRRRSSPVAPDTHPDIKRSWNDRGPQDANVSSLNAPRGSIPGDRPEPPTPRMMCHRRR
jgi:YVTN family beta-propeller protein